MRFESNGDHTYAFSNAPEDATLQFLAELLCGRYSVERVIQDSKDEVGADEFQAQKYIAWEHLTALTACALWFIATTKLAWAKDCQRDPELAQHLELEALPALSTTNVNEMMRGLCPSRNCLSKKPRLKSLNIFLIVPVQLPAACVSGTWLKPEPNVT